MRRAHVFRGREVGGWAVAHFLHAEIRPGHFQRISMDRAPAPPKQRETSRRPGPEEIAMANYRGVEIAPHTLESLVTWDVCGHAQRERDRMTPACRTSKAVQGGY